MPVKSMLSSESLGSCKAIKRTDENATADFRLIRKDGEWRICDVVFEGVSLIHNFRSQIYSFMNKSSYEELVKTFKQKHNKE